MDEFDRLWKRFDIDEEDNRSIFTNINRLKVMNTAINELMVVQNLTYYGYIEAFFPLHNEFELKGFNRQSASFQRQDDEEAKMTKKDQLLKSNLSELQQTLKNIM